MAKITCIIVEDEKPAQEVLKSYLLKTEWITLTAVFEDAISTLDFLKNNEVDLVFLDIQIPGLTGIEFLTILKNPPQVIITSAYSEYALDAFELYVLDYLKKPFSFERFLKAVNRVNPVGEISTKQPPAMNPVREKDFAFFNVNKTMVKIMFSAIGYIESMREYVYIHHDGNKVITKFGIGEIEKFLPENFIRIHRSYIVNLDKVTAYNAEEIFVGKVSLPIGTNYKKLVSSLL